MRVKVIAATGMRLAAPVFGERGLLLAAGTLVLPEHVERLADAGIRYVVVEDPRLAGLELPEGVPEHLLAALRKRYRVLWEQALALGGAVPPGGVRWKVSWEELRDLALQVVEHLGRCKPGSLWVGGEGRPEDHAADAAVLCGYLSRFAGLWGQAVDLVLAGLLHDLGEAVNPGPEHCRTGVALLRSWPVTAFVQAAVAGHHGGRASWSGVALLTVVEHYLSLLLGGRPPGAAWQAVLAAEDSDRRVVSAFRCWFAPYPVGCVVKLDAGREGVVVGYSGGMPHRPVVQPFGAGEATDLSRPEHFAELLV